MSNASQLLLLVDHTKLLLLERVRVLGLKQETKTLDSNIARSLESLREGIESLATRSPDDESLEQLRSEYDELCKLFRGEDTTSAATTQSSSHDPVLKDDFARAQSRISSDSRRQLTSNLRKQDSTQTSQTSKNVRFRDNPSQESLDEQDEANRAALFTQRYTDDDTDRVKTPDPTSMTNVQIHAYHQQVMAEQDEQLDRLGESIGRQRHLALQVGDELEGQISLLDEVDRGVDRHQSRLDGAKRRLKGNWGMTTIIVLIVILLLLIVLLK
ncbi:hypothetical protein HRR78_001507 [Exophiala dermatitidis]|nr:hypothetical protein HRR75_003723 [Exophiala dermatitidis]KAJ4557832.1 hypothetical protein HRR78_001507 [Exophiala dermatitidis]